MPQKGPRAPSALYDIPKRHYIPMVLSRLFAKKHTHKQCGYIVLRKNSNRNDMIHTPALTVAFDSAAYESNTASDTC